MPHKTITLKFVVLTVLAIALGIMISIGAAHLADKHPVPIDRYAVAGSREIADLMQGSEGVDQVPSYRRRKRLDDAFARHVDGGRQAQDVAAQRESQQLA